ncbi:NAD(P)/FAD-dependent oxidoreductase [Candidatus Woesearchaeota archaeon]|nr:NAD(P)/FAD-dependent oxidoreductase [Candidatus Woesearchaeota archaeon]
MIAIIGAGPAGGYLAYKLAQEGKEVTIYEEHEVVGKPVQCTGIVTKAYDHFEMPKNIIMNELEEVHIHAGRETVAIPLNEHVLNRHLLDETITKMAVKEGATLMTGHKYIAREGNEAIIQTNGGVIRHSFEFLAGCDGPNSIVAQTSGLDKVKNYYIASQATVEGDYDTKVFHTYFGENAPKFFGWSVPEHQKYSRVGVATLEKPGEYMNQIMNLTNSEKVTDRQGGVIPIYNPKARIMNETTALIGDAGGMIKATTGGGIITSMMQSRIVADKILGNPWKKDYKNLRLQLWLHYKIRLMLNKFTTKDYEKLLRLMNTARVKTILHKYPREYPTKFLYKLAIAQPRLAGLALMKSF